MGEDLLRAARRVERRLRARGLGPTLDEFADHVTLRIDPLKPVFNRHIALLYTIVAQAITDRKTAAAALKLVDEGVVLDLYATGEHHFGNMHYVGVLLNHYINIIEDIIDEDPGILLDEENAERTGRFAVVAAKVITLAMPHLRDSTSMRRAAAEAALSDADPTILGALSALSGVGIKAQLDDDTAEEAIIRLRNFFLHVLRELSWRDALRLIAEALNVLGNDEVSTLVRRDLSAYVVMWNAWLFKRLQELYGSRNLTSALLNVLKAYVSAVLIAGDQEGGVRQYINEVLRSLAPSLLNNGARVLEVFNVIVGSIASAIRSSTYLSDESLIRTMATYITLFMSDVIARAIDELNNDEYVMKLFSDSLSNAVLAVLEMAKKEGMLAEGSMESLINVITGIAELVVRALALLSLKFGAGLLRDDRKLISRVINAMYSQGWNELFLVTMLGDSDMVEEFINGSTNWREVLGFVIV
ncbi:MAG: hypothetical protein ACP5L5_06605 [Vulcanisaeta sp.]|uniref:hypothetical protein n=1 Tax=Vulcanisaeta sp. TaxID=2020871 RepID=UPI003D1143EB